MNESKTPASKIKGYTVQRTKFLRGFGLSTPRVVVNVLSTHKRKTDAIAALQGRNGVNTEIVPVRA